MQIDFLFQRLLVHHGVDTAALRGELAGSVRSADYMDRQGLRKVLESIPTGFPRFKAKVLAERLVVEKLRFKNDNVFSSTGTLFRLSIARPPALPITILNALVGSSITDLVAGPAFSPEMQIKSAASGQRTEAGISFPCLDLELEIPLMALTDAPGRNQSTSPAPDLMNVLQAGYAPIAAETAAEIVDAIDPADPRGWQDDIGYAGTMIGLRVEQRRRSPHICLRTPFSREIASAIGRGALGAWFDRETYAWCIAPGDFDPQRLLEAMAPFTPIVILDQQRAVLRPR